MTKLTDMTLRTLPIPPKGQVTYDDEGSPLKVRVSQGGSKTFLVLLGSGKRHTIGRYGEVTLQQAREAARRLRAEKTLGRIFPEIVSTEAARRVYLAQAEIRASTRSYTERNLNRLTTARLNDITPREINRILDSLSPSSAAQCLRVYTAFFNWCIRKHYLDKSPCARMQAAQSTSRARVLTDAELKSIWRACEQCSSGEPIRSEGSEVVLCARATLPTNFARIVQLLILTGQRRSEIASLQTSWISTQSPSPRQPAIAYGVERADFGRKSEKISQNSAPTAVITATGHQPFAPNDLWQITLPPEITKNGREHTIPLSSSACVLLRSCSSASSGASVTALIFPARGRPTTPFNGWSKSKAALDKVSGVTGWRIHDIRRTWATNMARLGVPIHVVEKMLNHITGSTGGLVGVYNRFTYWDEQVKAIEKYDAFMADLVR